MQALYLLGLAPVSETTADGHSYGFRRGRAARDALAQCFIVQSCRSRPEWVLEADITGCFDNISHDWMLRHVPMDKQVLRKWLKVGFTDKAQWFPTEAGTPQGGIASPTLANMVLDGLESRLSKVFPRRSDRKNSKVHLIRYADDFVITGASREVLERAKSEVETWPRRYRAEDWQTVGRQGPKSHPEARLAVLQIREQTLCLLGQSAPFVGRRREPCNLHCARNSQPAFHGRHAEAS